MNLFSVLEIAVDKSVSCARSPDIHNMASFMPSLLLVLFVLKQSAAASDISSSDPSLVDSHLSLKTTVFVATNLLTLFESVNQADIVEEKRGTLEACEELHRISISNLKESLSEVADLSKVRGLLSSVLANHWTCLEGLRSTSGPLKDVLESSFLRSYEHVNMSLSIIYKALLLQEPRHYRRLMSSAEWLSRDDRSVLEAPIASFHPGEVITVAADGSGMFRTISNAIRLAVPDNSDRRTIIHIKKGIYPEVLNIPAHKTNIFLVGEGDGQTVITGQRNWVDGWQTFKTATVGKTSRVTEEDHPLFSIRSLPNSQYTLWVRFSDRCFGSRIHGEGHHIREHGRTRQAPSRCTPSERGICRVLSLRHPWLPGHTVCTLRQTVLPRMQHLGNNRLHMRRCLGCLPVLPGDITKAIARAIHSRHGPIEKRANPRQRFLPSQVLNPGLP